MEFKLDSYESLKQISSDWDFDKDGDPKELEERMIKFMIYENGIGLAANQIGITKNIFVIGSYNNNELREPFAVINPKIISVSKETSIYKEGCLSFPNFWFNIKRPKKVLVEYTKSDKTVVKEELDGLISRCFQHEYDHLKGICFIDIVSPLKLQLALKKNRKIK